MKRKPHRASTPTGTPPEIYWAKQLRMDAEFARRILLDMGEVRPMFVIHTPHHIKIVQTEWRDAEQKQMTYHVLGMMCLVEGAIGLSFIAEGWVRDVSKLPGESRAEHQARACAVLPSEAEDRQEVLMVSSTFRTDTGKQEIGEMLDIVRNDAGKVIAAPRRPGDAAAKIEHSAIGDILSDDPMPEHLRPAARKIFERISAHLGFHIETVPIHPAGHA